VGKFDEVKVSVVSKEKMLFLQLMKV